MDLPTRRPLFTSSRPDPQDALAVIAGEVVAPERHPAVVYLASLSAGSRRTMAGALNVIAEIATGTPDLLAIPWHQLDYGHTAAIRSKLAEVYAPATGNRMLAAMRGVLKTAFRLGLISSDQMTRAISVEAVRGSRIPAGRAISQGELRAIFGVCDPAKPVGARDAALLALLYAAGLRRAEVVGLDLADFDALVGGLVVHGKGNKQRKVFITNGARAALDAWLLHRGDEPGALLLPVRKGGTIQRRRMTDQAVAERLRLLGSRAKLQHFSAHDLRRSFVGDLLDAGADIATVQALAGHASPTTTSKYDRRGERTKLAAAGMLHVPFGG
jgi:site-specific recombinase XerD